MINMKATPITQKCKSSPMKMNMALIEGNAQTLDRFEDSIGGMVSTALDKDEKKQQVAPEKQATPEPPKVDYTKKFKEMGESLSKKDFNIEVPDMSTAIKNLSGF